MPARGSIHCFNPHTRVGHNGLGGHDHARVIDISIHAPAWDTTSSAAAAGPIRSCFNPRAHVGRDTFTLFRINEIMSVSIHAPAWGATVSVCLLELGERVSIHAPAWGATQFWPRSSRSTRCFNPRARVGRDPQPAPEVSPVAPFQSTRPRGARHDACQKSALVQSFQSTRPRGARQSHHNSLRDKDFFQGIREPMLPLDPKGTGQVAATQKTNEINMLLKCEPSRESRTA